MPIEFEILRHQPPPLAKCPKCGAEPFIPDHRGCIQRRQYTPLGKRQDYCALICHSCLEIVGFESPPYNARCWKSQFPLRASVEWLIALAIIACFAAAIIFSFYTLNL